MGTDRKALPPSTNPEGVGNFPFRLGHAYRSFRRLIADKEDTAQVFEIIGALSGRSIEKGYLRMLGSAEGARQAYLAEELADKLGDDAWLATFASETVGAQYRAFVRLRNISAHGLVEESRKATLNTGSGDTAHPVAWFARRLRDVHDIWHVLTGFSTDTLGEGCLLGFTFAQTKNPGFGFITFGGALELTRAHWRQPYIQAAFQAWQIGRKADWLPALDYERLFAQPLEEARRELRLSTPTVYHSIPLEARGAYRYSDERELKIARAKSAQA
jgi:ubiquinone biosynthesis protein COQ4